MEHVRLKVLNLILILIGVFSGKNTKIQKMKKMKKMTVSVVPSRNIRLLEITCTVPLKGVFV